MFLVNVPPVVSLQKQWAPFGQTASCRLPVYFSESEEDITGTRVCAQVKGIINNLQSDESSLDVTSEYECIMQKNRKGELNIDRGLKNCPSIIKGHTRDSATLVVPAQFKEHTEDSSQLGPLILESDSDDSVDRDIEEAIQEYLKTKSNTDTSSQEQAKAPSTSPKLDLLKLGQKSVLISTCPAPQTLVSSSDTSSSFGLQNNPRSVSPASVSSDDSFEQSIKDEIEQFLNEKKQQSTKNEIASVKKNAHNETPVKPKVRISKICEKQTLKHGSKQLFVGQHSESPTLLAKCPKPKVESFQNSNNRTQSKSKLPSINEKPCIIQTVKEELSDSSSDDGIEEAIQLYQLEKNRKEGNLSITLNVPPIKEEKVKTSVEATINVGPCGEKPSSPKVYKKPENRKRKILHCKPTAFKDNQNCQDLTAKRLFSSENDGNPKCQTGIKTTYRVETAAELMCAEAILDISKTIFPSHPEGTYTVKQESPIPSSEPVQPQCGSDSSIDSDDSIEQEIRSFLALKAQAESTSTAPVKQEPLSSQSINQPSLSKAKLSLTQKRKLKEENTFLHQDGPQISSSQSSNVYNSGEIVKDLQPEGNVQKDSVINTDGLSQLQCLSDINRQTGHEALDSIKVLKSSTVLNRDKRKFFNQTRSSGSGDKSSSLDSDEDLDTAIKDLLKSKRKLKKRPKDTRPQCKKKVRFGEITTKPLEIFDGSDQKDILMKNTPFIKSCLVNPINRENPLKKTKTILKRTEEKQKQVTVGSSSIVTTSNSSKDFEIKPISASDDMTCNSKNAKARAFSDAQDSSSVDSDDSIEQEIRKFLAERARASAELAAAQTVPSVLGSTVEKVKDTRSFKENDRGLSLPVTVVHAAEVKSPSATNAQAAAVHQLTDTKQNLSHIGQLYHRPIELSKGANPVIKQEPLIVKNDFFVDQNHVLKPSEACLQTAHGRVVLKTDVNGSQGKTHLPISGNFVAGLKYVSGTEAKLVLNTVPSRVSSDVQLYKTGVDVTKLGGCQPVLKKGIVLEKSRDLQSSNIAPKIPLVRSGVYLLTTKVCKENSPSLCLPVSAASHETGINVMSIQYRCGQADTNTSPCVDLVSLQQHKRVEIRDVKLLSTENTPSKAGEVLSLDTKTKMYNTAREVVEYESRPSNINEEPQEDLDAGSGRNVKESSQEQGKVSNFSHFSTSIDPGLTVQPYILLSPEQIYRHYRRSGCLRNATKSQQISYTVKADI
ncbi:protein phosphatase 1 regulatory subunit 26 [Bombina bombina]|uniref:protein phosphatase 1 regulatory subunit 26 n=1 Tax=Bombina bombina TaxID=8345 RepID=UPI00235B290A|nr:protein phosphatase 1 regulatory subunit 26 [Bombina bombina]